MLSEAIWAASFRASSTRCRTSGNISAKQASPPIISQASAGNTLRNKPFCLGVVDYLTQRSEWNEEIYDTKFKIERKMTCEITELQSTVVVSAIAVVALIAREALAFEGVKVCSWNKFLQGSKGAQEVQWTKLPAFCLINIISVWCWCMDMDMVIHFTDHTDSNYPPSL